MDSTLWSLAFTGQAKPVAVNIALVYFTNPLIVHSPLLNLPACMPKLQPADALFSLNGMSNQLKDASSQTAIMSMCAITVPLIHQ